MGKGTIIRQIFAQFKLDTTEFQQKSKEIKDGMSRLGTELNNLKTQLKIHWDGEKYNQAMAKAAERTKLAGDKVALFRDELNRAKTAIGEVDKNSEAWVALNRKIQETEKELLKAETAAMKAAKELAEIQKLSLDRVTDSIKKAGNNLEAFGKKASIVSAAITAGFAFGVKAAIDMERAMAGVSKTTDLTGEALQAMRDDIIALSKEIPVAATELAKIAEIAGQLGVENENIMAFTRTMADLGTVTNLAGTTGAEGFAKFANITQMAQGDVDKLGSSVFALDKSTATTASSIMEMALRLAAAGSQAGMSEAEIIGLAGALSSVGLEAQAGGTAFSKAINQIQIAVETGSEKVEQFATVAGMSASQFAEAWRTDAASALLAFTQGLGDTSRLGQSTIVTLDELGLTEVRLSDALRRAAGSGDLFAKSLDISKNAWKENTALAEGASVVYETTAGKMQLAKNEVTALGIQLGDHFLPVIADVLKGVGNFAEYLIDLDERTGGLVTKIGLFIAIFGPMTSILGKAAGKFADLVAKIGTWIAANVAAKASQDALNGSMIATPWGAIGTAIGLVISAVTAFGVANSLVKSEVEQATEAIRDQREAFEETRKSFADQREGTDKNAAASLALVERMKELLAVQDDDAGRKQELKTIVEKLNEANGNLNLTYDEQTNTINQTVGAVEDLIEAHRKEAEAKIVMDELYALYERQREIEKNQGAERSEAFKELKAQWDLLSDTERLDAELNQVLKSFRELTIYTDENIALYKELHAEETEHAKNLETISALQNELAGIMEGSTGPLKTIVEDTGNAADATNDLTKAIEEEQKALDKSISSYDSLTKTLDAVTSGQSLTYSGIMNLIQQYPQLATQIQKTKDGYTIQEEALRLLAQAELDAQIAIQESALARAIAAEEEARRSIDAKMAAVSANNLATQQFLKDDNAALEQILASQTAIGNTIAMMQELRDSLNSPWTPTKTGGSKKEEETPEEKRRRENLETYNAQREDLKWHLEMEYITEEEYYAKLDELAKRYLEEGSKDWKAYMLDRKKFNDDLAKESLKAEEDAEKERIKLYNQGVDDAKYARAISTKDALDAEDEYYERLRWLRNEYLTEGTKEYQDATVALISHYGSLAAVEAGIVEESTARFNAAMKEDQRNITEHYGDTIDGQRAFIEAYKKNRDTFLKEGTEAWKAANDTIAQLERDLADDIEAEWKRIEDARKQAEDERQREYEEWIASMKAAFDRGRREIEYKRDMDLITEEEFYKKLRELQQQYLWHPALQDDSRGVDVEIYQWEKRMKEAAERARQEELKQQEREIAEREALAKKEAQAAYDERKKQIQKELDLEKKRLNEIIQNIDDELAARDKLNEDEDYAKRLAKLQMDIEYERNAENRIELEKELLRLQQEREDELYREQKEAEKDAVRQQIDAAETLADRQIEEAERARDALLEQYEELYAVMVEQLTGKPREMPLTAVQEAYDAARRQIEQSMGATIQQDNRQTTYPISVSTVIAVTPEMIAAVVRNEIERLMLGR